MLFSDLHPVYSESSTCHLCAVFVRAFRSGHTWYTKKGTHVKNKGFLLLCCQGCEAVCLYVCHVVSALCMLIKIEALVIRSCFAQFRARLRVEMIWPCSTHSHFASLQQSTRTLAMASTPLPGFVDCKQSDIRLQTSNLVREDNGFICYSWLGGKQSWYRAPLSAGGF